MEETNVTNTTDAIRINDAVERFPFFVVIFCNLPIFSISSNLTTSYFIWRYTKKNNHVVFVMFICMGNSVCSLYFFLASLGQKLKLRHICSISSFIYSWGMIYFIAMTFWISLNQYIIAHNLNFKKYLQKRVLISVLTGIIVKIYLVLFYLTIVDTNNVKCDTEKVFGDFFLVYMCALTAPYVAVFSATAIVYKKTLAKIRHMAASADTHQEKKKVRIKKDSKEGTRGHSEQADFKRLEDMFLDITKVSSLASGERSENIEMEDINIDIVNQSCRVSGKQTEEIEIEVINIENETKPGTSSGCKDLVRRCDVPHQANWHVKSERTVRMILIQATVYGMSIIASMIGAYLGFRVIRLTCAFITFLCLFVSPFQFAAKIPEVKSAMMKGCRCKQNVVGSQP